nr:shikimate O-hydroxycinnamoyltransferase-like [Ipomoea batatas]
MAYNSNFKVSVTKIEATELKCGGIVVACTFDHRVGDAYSTNMFLVSWSEIAQAKQPSQLPCFRRSLLFPRRPGHYNLSVANMYVPISSLLPPEPGVEESLISRIYCVTAEQITHLQSQANDYSDKDSADKLKHPRCTKVEAFCAFLWKTVASGESRRYFKNFRFWVGEAGVWIVSFSEGRAIGVRNANAKSERERGLDCLHAFGERTGGIDRDLCFSRLQAFHFRSS